MKNLSEYYNDNLVFSGSDIMLTEGFWSKLGNILGLAKTYPTKLSKEFRDAYATAMYLGAQSDNDKEKERMKKEAEAAEKGDKELMKELKASLEDLDRMVNDGSIKNPQLFQAKVRQYKELVDKYKDKSGIKYANTLQKLIDDKWPKASQEYEKARKKVENSGVAANKKEKTNKGKEKSKDTKKKSEKKSDNKDTQKQIDNIIVDNKDVLKTLSEKCGYKGQKLSDFITYITADKKILDVTSDDFDNKVFAATLIISGAILMNDMDVYKKISDYLAEQNDVSSLKKQIADFGSKKDE